MGLLVAFLLNVKKALSHLVFYPEFPNDLANSFNLPLIGKTEMNLYSQRTFFTKSNVPFEKWAHFGVVHMVQVILIEIYCANLHELFCQFIS